MKSRTDRAHPLGMLSPDDCEALLAYHALGAVNFDNHPDLKPAGEKIAAKCAGLPLAAKTVGGVLRSKDELNEWTAIAESKIWDLPEETNGVPQALKLSYFYLPSDLKRCFAYCAVFHKDYEFKKDDLPSSQSNSLFVMHDLLNDLAASIAVIELKKYRIALGVLRHLRYLNLSGSPIKCLPSSMSTLCNLEALILQYCGELVELPSWINKLINLRCVDIRGTPSLKKMPRGIGSLVKLEILPKFIVGGDDGPKLKELKDLQFLREELTIEGLCNVGEVGDAREAALNAKTGLTSLILRWEDEEEEEDDDEEEEDEGPASGRDAESQMQILDCLQPHASIKNLEIDGYGGEGLPPNLEVLAVSECENLNQPMSKWGLKRTAALRRLTISGKIGCLVGTNSFPPPPDHEEEEEDEGPGQDKGGWHVLPPSLLYLLVLNQENLVTISSGMQSHLTSLLCLSIQGSPKLKLLPREGLPASLLILYIEGCTEDLVKRCSKEGGGGGGGSRDYYFPLIERIPEVEIHASSEDYYG
ncbi:hypothetical protein CDL15_Pgr016650 [Punica granatum]|uniref:R13L1/DRL21-like LRR repeat region domain-containing protein n=1 Tax=Punica granatum TaxID=22663 RepID=A0A218XSS1_PUNGR|nr:hypothetical protein CDL15_Pgr016650 [Punica granatum]